ncbi:MAG: glycosyltransferase, partial [Vicinamibacterales bacterium]
MRVLLGVAWYFPDSIGGTEKYVRGLAAELREAGHDVAIAVPVAADRPATADLHEGVRVFRFPADADPSHAFDLGQPAPPGWQHVLDAFAPTIVDLHSLTSVLGIAHLRAARASGARTVVTTHLPGVVCARGTLLRFGHEPCDGDLQVQPCTACRLQARGLPIGVGSLLSEIPPGVASWFERLPLPGLARRAVTVDDAHHDRLAWLQAVAGLADRLVVVSNGLKGLLTRNGVPADKVVVCGQGVDRHNGPRRPAGAREAGTLKVGFVGRFDPLKGLDVLLDAAERLPADARIEIHIWGTARTPAAEAYRAAILRNAQSIRHVVFHGEADSSAPYDEVDVLAVPSICFETGPFVVLEAHAAGIPVVGSDLGGIAERVSPGRDGLLFPAGDGRALAEILLTLWRDPAELARLRPSTPVRSVADVARETLHTYAALAAERA